MYGLMHPNVLLKICNDTVLHSSRLDHVYAINLDHISPMDLSYLKAFFNDAWLWHHILRHASLHTSYKLTKHDLVRRITPYKFEKYCLCSECVRGKQVCASSEVQTIKKCVYLTVHRIVAYGPM